MDTTLNGTLHVQADKAALELQTTHLRVLMLLKQKKLAGCQAGGEWYVERSSLDWLKIHGIDPIEEPSCRTHCTSSVCGCKGR